ncbi:ABC transporter substrate-binding protein [Natrinema thermotolerans]|uniref:ABC transporter substrate-binding protein n=1 Tax=Natrinema thermotolerans TaxID=121872 RepID=A0AAF0P6S0_9EURY|nr:ABC transporter substrate-binding protein [Natrinema thermotolerans]QCC59353.1 ABC transporter substrate-binding protein [Natrinema thermotolerans]WMT06323.1 ABC transporter substrate-binding protein [Natrinema thermotolerans]
MNGSKGHGTEPNDHSTSRSRALDRRRLLRATGGVAAGASLAGCLGTYESIVGGSATEGPVRIGLLAPDPDSDQIGRSMERGASVAVDELNDNDGIDGRDVELVVGDTNGSPSEARRQYQRLILEEGVDVTIGVFASEALMNIIDDIAEQETVHLTSGAATTAVSQRISEQYEKYKYHFRVGPNNNHDLGQMQVDFLTDKADDIGWNSVAVLVEDYDWTEEPWKVYQNQLPNAGVDVVMEEQYPPATEDFTAIYDEVEAAGADAAFITTAHTGTDALLDWVTPQPRPFAFGGIHVPMQLPSYYEATNEACRFGVGQSSATAQSERTDKTEPFVNAYQDAYGGSSPVYTGYHTYDAVALFADAVENTGTFDADELVSYMEEVSFTGTAGTVEFYGRDHQYTHDLRYNSSDPDPVYFQWQENEDGEGSQEIIWPEDRATAEYQTPTWLA